MTGRWLVLQLLCLALCGCSSGRQVWVAQPHHSFAYWRGWDGTPNQTPVRKSNYHKPEQRSAEQLNTEDKSAIERREAQLDILPKYSHEWVVLRNKIDAEEDARIAKILVICRGCETASSKPSLLERADVDSQATRPGLGSWTPR
jgi:hypothetical protein